jgi:hypothetical protein
MSTDHLLSLASRYAEAHGKAERFRPLADTRPASRSAEYEAIAARWDAAVVGFHAELRTALRKALPDGATGGNHAHASAVDGTTGTPRRVACPGLADSCRTDPDHVDILDRLNLRVYPPQSGTESTEYLLLDLFDVSIGVQRRANDLYLHLDTTETPDRTVAVEINGGGETNHPTTPVNGAP